MYPYQYNSLIQSQNAYEQNLKNIINQANGQLQQLQQMQNPMQIPQQPTNLTQNFQLAPNSNNNELESKYAEDIDEVKNTFVTKTGIFITKALDTLWIKNVNGDIRTFNLNEVIPQDPKDIEINNLKKELQRMKEMINYGNESDVNNSDFNEPDESKVTTKLSGRSKSNAKQK